MRQQLDIYASLVLCKSVPGFPTRHRDVDFAIIRENTEGEYSGLEHQVSFSLFSFLALSGRVNLFALSQSSPGVVESLKIMTRYKSERIARFAFDFAIKNNRKVCPSRISLEGDDYLAASSSCSTLPLSTRPTL